MSNLTGFEKLSEFCEELADRFGIRVYYNHVVNNNPSNHLPYHNLFHTLCMVRNCYTAASHYNLPYESVRHLLVAALFHDFAHSGGEYGDDVNVKDAVGGFNKFWNIQLRVHSAAAGIDNKLVERIIEVTQYPYVRQPVCIEESIIRDCDLLQMLEPEWREHVIGGLQKEMSIRLGQDLTLGEMLEGQIKFMTSVKFFTEWAFRRAYKQEPEIGDLAPMLGLDAEHSHHSITTRPDYISRMMECSRWMEGVWQNPDNKKGIDE
jgi:hypothetical protein